MAVTSIVSLVSLLIAIVIATLVLNQLIKKTAPLSQIAVHVTITCLIYIVVQFLVATYVVR